MAARMIDKFFASAEAALADIPDGATIMIGGFGNAGMPAALIDALRSHRIAGAGLDVLEGEPAVPPMLPELLQFENVVVTPHVSGRAPEARTAVVTKTRSPQMIGDEWPRPGISVFH